MILSDATIRAEIAAGRIGVEPFDESKLQPSSVDVTLDPRFLVFRNHTHAVIDVEQDMTDLLETVPVPHGEDIHFHPRGFEPRSPHHKVDRGGDLYVLKKVRAALQPSE